MSKTNCVILAAGEGKRMFARSSKVLCEIAYKPMILWVTDAALNAGVDSICAVVSDDDVRAVLPESCEVRYQKERLGTGHAVLTAEDYLEQHKDEDTLILYGDVPFMDSETIIESLQVHRGSGAAVTVISAVVDDPTGYGRIVRAGGRLREIVEELDCDDITRSIKEINSGAAWFKTKNLIDAIKRINNNNARGEYYLTDAIGILIAEGEQAECYRSASPLVALGVNKPIDLLNMNDMAKEKMLRHHLDRGVRFVSRDGIVISPDVEIEAGATILPGTVLYGKTKIGRDSVIGPNSLLFNVTIGERTVFNESQGYNSVVGSDAKIGPFVQLRPNCRIGDLVKIGDFVEIKNSNIGEGTSISHLTYIGDADVGEYCNFGCGTVFVNYDGEKKNRTTVKDFAFIGCNTNLIAPVTVGRAAFTAAGTTVTKDVPDGALALDRGTLIFKEGWGERKLRSYIEKKTLIKEENEKKREENK
ncbi:MAG: bifunctional UDP-N-acetylglucosamine diphosphorylase/glucosamine-1-phosphate N-acetyltransferase GlmU [Oscillospiraceae bacterium]|jgi:bifunctional UDP-N-acetylglucosamine pyrophosphorylase/glucosamine-1-phosphate N-acetyltransferase